MKIVVLGIVKAVLVVLFSSTLIGCRSSQPNARHDDAELSTDNQTKQSMRWQPELITYEGYGDPTVFISDGFDVTTEGPMGGATILPDGTMQIVSQSDGSIARLTRTDGDGTQLIIEDLVLSPSITRQARAEALDRFVSIWSQLSETQREEIREKYATFRAGIEGVSDVAADALTKLIMP